VNKKRINDDTEALRLRAAIELYDNAPCGSVSFLNDGRICDINLTLCHWLGYEKEELIDKRTLPSLFKIGGQIFFETHFFPLIKMQDFIREVYFDIEKKDKSVLHGLINVRKFPELTDGQEVYQATILDISDRWQYEATLLEAKRKAEMESKAKAEFLATISHEIRTPLNSILGIGNLLHKTPLNKNQKKYASLLLHSSEHLLSLVNNLLDLSKIEAQKITLEHIPFNIFELISVLEHTFSVKAKEKGIKLKVKFDKKVPHNLIGDPIKLKQILTNLIGNAIKFTKKGSVRISITSLNEVNESCLLKFEVIDTGIGIPEEKLETVFQEFSQASYDVNVEFGGTGLGLTISKKLLELHNSTLSVSSTVNRGSTFSFEIRYAVEKDPSTKQLSSLNIKPNYDFKNMHVLIVDDNPANIFIAEQYLDQWNVKYTSAESGADALKLLKRKKVDLILLDLQMPKMSGYETAKRIRQLKIKSNPAIIAFSASTKGEVKPQLDEAGIDDHLPKPFEPKALYEILLEYKSGSKKLATQTRAKHSGTRSSTRNVESSKSKKAPLSKLMAPPSFNLERYKKMANNKLEYLNKFRLSTLDGLISYQKDFEIAIRKKDVKLLSELIHKSTMSLYYIEATILSEHLKECRSILKEDPVDNELFSSKVKDCNDEFTKIIKGLENYEHE
jgi:PAS domain S-box-containing protein